MFKTIGLCVIAGALLGCSSSSTAACGTIAASYSDSETLVSKSSPSCPLPAMAMAMGTVTVTGAGPDHEVAIPGIQGTCPATSDGCSLDVQCTIGITDSSGNGAGSAKLTTDWTFTTTGFTGPSTLVVTESDGTTCTFDFTDVASKQ